MIRETEDGRTNVQVHNAFLFVTCLYAKAHKKLLKNNKFIVVIHYSE